MGSRVKRGFTLVEVLVTTIVIGVLAAVVVPAMMRQTTAADPAQMASDLINIRTGLENFSVNLRPYAPGDLEDLVNPIVATDQYLPATGVADISFQFSTLSNSSTVTAAWKGPYLARSHATAAAATGPSGWSVGSGGQIDSDFYVCSSSAVSTTQFTVGQGCVATGQSGFSDMITIKLTGITATEFANLNQLIDGTETVTSTTGLLRYFTSGTTNADVYFLALPYTAP